jgi:putative transcriptional regulator
MSKLFTALKKGLEEAIEHDQGKLDLRSALIDIPKPPTHYKAKEIKKIREKNRYSQGIFALILNVSVKTVQSWESGQRKPSQSALRLLEIVDKGIYNPVIHAKN